MSDAPPKTTPRRGRRPATAQNAARPKPEYHAVDFQEIKTDPEVLALIDAADRSLAEIGYTDHGIRHIARVAARAMRVIRDLGLPEREAQLAGVAAYLHDIGNVVHRTAHAQSSAIMAFDILTRRRMDPTEIGLVMSAIGNHDEGIGEPVNNPSAALILADKSDVLRSRVRSMTPMLTRDIHDRVNYAATDSRLEVDREGRFVTLRLTIDTEVASVMDYFEIFLGRMAMCRRAANYLNCDFALLINETRLL
ncbi:MAG: HD domain-containing protein [Candidatus Sumerlaeia bacterium]|nr:HD domain-containing protein [Candidatus Sumerlaeia bacterium]